MVIFKALNLPYRMSTDRILQIAPAWVHFWMRLSYWGQNQPDLIRCNNSFENFAKLIFCLDWTHENPCNSIFEIEGSYFGICLIFVSSKIQTNFSYPLPKYIHAFKSNKNKAWGGPLLSSSWVVELALVSCG